MSEYVIFEGIRSISAVINGYESGVSNRRIISVLYDKERESTRRREIAYLRSKGAEMDFSVEETTSDVINALSIGNTHGGIAAKCTDRFIPPLTDKTVFEKTGFYIMLEGIEDPYNFGYALRTLYAAGADGVILSPRNWMSAASTVCRSSAGASELIHMYTASPADAVSIFRSNGFKIAAAGIRDSVSSFDADLTRPIFLIIGGEKRGISRAVLECADFIVRLDYGRKFKGSLSTASAAAVLAYEVLRQNRTD